MINVWSMEAWLVLAMKSSLTVFLSKLALQLSSRVNSKHKKASSVNLRYLFLDHAFRIAAINITSSLQFIFTKRSVKRTQ